MEAYWAAPPVSRTITAFTLATSLLVYGGLFDGNRVILYLPWIFKFPPELWRLFSSFWLTSPGLGILFDTYFLWTYSSGLEKESPRFSQPGNFFVYMIFVGVFILISAGGILGGMSFAPALVLALAYTYSQDNKGKKMTFFIITFDVMWLPYSILLMTFIQFGAGVALFQATGLLAAHLYDFLTRIWPTFGSSRSRRSLVPTPAVVRRWFGGGVRLVQNRGFGTSYTSPVPGSRTTTATTATQDTGFSSSFQNAWGNRGPGRRLGGT